MVTPVLDGGDVGGVGLAGSGQLQGFHSGEKDLLQIFPGMQNLVSRNNKSKTKQVF